MVLSHISRHSTSSEQSSGSTAIDPMSAQQSPKLPNELASYRPSPTAKPCPVRHISGREPHTAKDREGWPHLAQIMSEVPEFAAFSRFRELNVKNLLYYQAELKILQRQITLHEEEHTLDVTCYEALLEDSDSCYHGLLIRSRRLLREYNEALLQFTNISALPDPDSLNMRSLRSWLKYDKGGDYHIEDKFGPDKTWGRLDTNEPPRPLWTQCWNVFCALIFAQDLPACDDDLVVTQPDAKVDGLTRWVAYHLIPLWWEVTNVWQKKRKLNPSASDIEMTERAGDQTTSKRRSKAYNTLESISEHTALRFTSGLTTVIACLMPVVAIAVLTQVHGTRDLLLCITGFAVMFAVLLIFLTQGISSRTDIFAATAAFSAVLVVFISQPVIDINMPPGTQSPEINL